MVSYAKYSLVPTDEPDKNKVEAPDGRKGDGGGKLLTNMFTTTHKPPSINKSTLPPPPNSAFDYSSAFNFKSAFEYNSQTPNMYKSAFDYGYTHKDAGGTSAGSGKKDRKMRGGLSLSCDATKCLSAFVTALSYIFILFTFPCSLPFCFKKLEQWERIVVFRLGRLRGVFGPGVVFIIPWSDRTNRVDMRTKAFSVPPQQVITCDNGIVEVGCEVKYRVSDVQRLTTSVTTPEHGLRNFGKTVLLNILTKQSVKEMERDKHALASNIQRELNMRVQNWGIEIGQVDMSQITVLKEPEPNDPLKPLLGALGSFGGGGSGASNAPGSTTIAQFPTGGALGSIGAKDLAPAASFLSGLLGGATKQAASKSSDSTSINIPGLSGTSGSDSSFSGMSDLKPKKGYPEEEFDCDTAPLLSSQNTSTVAEKATDKLTGPVTPLGQYLQSLISAAGPNDLTHGVYRLVVEGTPDGTSIFTIFIGAAGIRQVVECDLTNITPDVSITLEQSDLHAIFSGSLPPLQAYLSGRLVVQGSVQMLMGLQALQEVHQNLSQNNKDGSFIV